MYSHLWGTGAVRAVFDEPGRVQGWLDVLAALARAQAAYGLVPQVAADQISALQAAQVDLDLAAGRTRATGHSTLGLIDALRECLPAETHAHVYVGMTVQDLTDTWTATALRVVLAEVRRDLLRIQDLALALAVQHRDTVMAGRTHGQPGAPITFGWKVASWADEVGRHLDRLAEGKNRWLVGQLGGGVGTLASQGPHAMAIRARFCAELGLADPGMAWLTSRDRIAEVTGVLAMITGTLARIGGEVYELQRPEIGELREGRAPGVVASITMPHKRNPEGSEHLDTLARLVRANASVLLEGMVGGHERDGRSWKAEWVALPEVCLLSATATSLAVDLLERLEVDADAMLTNLPPSAVSEQALALLTPRLGKHAAQAALQSALSSNTPVGLALAELLHPAELARLGSDTGQSAAMIDLVVARRRS